MGITKCPYQGMVEKKEMENIALEKQRQIEVALKFTDESPYPLPTEALTMFGHNGKERLMSIRSFGQAINQGLDLATSLDERIFLAGRGECIHSPQILI